MLFNRKILIPLRESFIRYPNCNAFYIDIEGYSQLAKRILVMFRIMPIYGENAPKVVIEFYQR